MASARRTARCLFVASSLLAVSCGTSTTASVVRVESADGMLSLEYPQRAAPDGVRATITARTGDALPEALKRVGIGGTVYELGPDGTRFTSPVTVTRVIDRHVIEAALKTDLGDAMPLALLALHGSDGSWEWLGDQTMRPHPTDTSKTLVSGTTTHFSEVVALSGHFQVGLAVASIGGVRATSGSWEVGQEFDAFPFFFSSTRQDSEAGAPNLRGVRYAGAGVELLSRGSSPNVEERGDRWRCEKPGAGPLVARFTILEAPLARFTGDIMDRLPVDDFPEGRALTALLGEHLEMTVEAQAEIECRPKGTNPSAEPSAATGPFAVKLDALCMRWFHIAHGDYLSTVRYFALLDVLQGAGLTKGGSVRYSLTVEGVNGGKPMTGEVKLSRQASISSTGGINQPGSHPIKRFAITGPNGEIIDLTAEAVKRSKSFRVGNEDSGEQGECENVGE